jgi:ELWxxDGT repeat protein
MRVARNRQGESDGSSGIERMRVFFGAFNGVSSDELWKSNGTAAGTVLVKDIRPGKPGPGPNSLTNVNA